MQTISVCMIVKNEEAVLARCLNSLSGLYEELIIVDTGSTDKTKEIALGYTDKLYDFTWTGSFSDARNFAFSKCTKDFIYAADADEVLDEENRKRFALLKEALLPEVEIVQMKYGNQMQFSTIYNYEEEYRPKLYKRIRTFTWEEPIHEAVRLQPLIFDSDVVITHMPQGSHTKRDLSTFYAMHQKGISFSKRMHNLFAKELFVSGTKEDFLSAGPIFLQFVNERNRSEEEIIESCCVLAKYGLLQKDTTLFFKYAMKGVLLGSCSELCFLLGEYYRMAGDEHEALLWYHNAAYETEPILSIAYQNDLPKKYL